MKLGCVIRKSRQCWNVGNGGGILGHWRKVVMWWIGQLQRHHCENNRLSHWWRCHCYDCRGFLRFVSSIFLLTYVLLIPFYIWNLCDHGSHASLFNSIAFALSLFNFIFHSYSFFLMQFVFFFCYRRERETCMIESIVMIIEEDMLWMEGEVVPLKGLMLFPNVSLIKYYLMTVSFSPFFHKLFSHSLVSSFFFEGW